MPPPRQQAGPHGAAPVLLSVLAGGCVGGALRHLLATTHATTLAVNLAGAALLGLLVVLGPPRWRPLLGTGFCGGLTTFGSVTVATDRELAHGRYAVALALLVLNLLGGVLAAAGAVVLAERLRGPGEPVPEDPDLEAG